MPEGDELGASEPEPLMLTMSEFRRIKANASVRSRSAVDRERQAAAAERQRLAEEAAARRESMGGYTRAKV